LTGRDLAAAGKVGFAGDDGEVALKLLKSFNAALKLPSVETSKKVSTRIRVGIVAVYEMRYRVGTEGE